MAAAKWALFFRQSLHLRLSAPEVQDLSAVLQKQSPILSKKLVKILFECQKSFCVASDPLPALYLGALVTGGIVVVSDITYVFLYEFQASFSKRTDKQRPINIDRLTSFTSIVQELINIVCSGIASLDAAEASRNLLHLSKCLSLIHPEANRSFAAAHHEDVSSQIVLLLESTATLLCAFVASEAGMLPLMDTSEKGKLGTRRTCYNFAEIDEV